MEFGPLKKAMFTLEHLKKAGEAKSPLNTMLKEFDKLDQFIFDYVPLP